jgi:trehalose-phosphatase
MKGDLQHALSGLAAPDERFLFFDYDGTLSPIASRAAVAFTQPGALEELETLAQRPATRVGIVTGRPLEEIRSRIPSRSFFFAALHGLVIEGPDVSMVFPEAARLKPVIRKAVSELESELEGLEGVYIEDKGLTAAVHYRQANDDASKKAANESRRIASAHEGIRTLPGKEVVELRPDVDWDKGSAIEWILEQTAGSDWEERVGVLYVGDDQTDEDAFRRLGSRAVTVRVGDSGATHAKYRVSGPADLVTALAELNSLLATDNFT